MAYARANFEQAYAPARRMLEESVKPLLGPQTRLHARTAGAKFQYWLKDLATITKNRMEPADKTIPSSEMTTRPTIPQRRALELLKVKI